MYKIVETNFDVTWWLNPWGIILIIGTHDVSLTLNHWNATFYFTYSDKHPFNSVATRCQKATT